MTAYEPPRVTFVGSDPKIPALRAAISRVAKIGGHYMLGTPRQNPETIRFVALWAARNRRTRVLIERVRRANAA